MKTVLPKNKQTKRPHYHVILFNCDFDDKTHFRTTEKGDRVFISKTLTDLWGHGNSEFGYAQPGSIAYLFKYVLKKKSRAEKKEPLYIERDGTTYEVAHEFIEASRNPGIGACMRGSDSLKKGYLTVNGAKQPLPKYYLEWLRVNDPEAFDTISNMKFDFMNSKPKETTKRKAEKEKAQLRLISAKKRL